MDFPRLLSVEPRPHHRIFLRYADGVEGMVDMAARTNFKGVFERIRDESYFNRVHRTPERHIAWDDELDICANAQYLNLIGKTYEEWDAGHTLPLPIAPLE